ncbi:6,7-dimethyl-8-ribityllumazine synthase-like protein [Atractiella rhizophila]|nr:6,7-dimethyl-8-ribityllumazine synthase-like protein [Atractiella rhizophila]
MSADKTIKGLTESTETFDGSPLRILIVHARWNMDVIQPLLDGAIKTLTSSGVKSENIVIQTVPGSYELPYACAQAISASQIQSAAAAPTLLGSIGDLTSLTVTSPAPPAPSSQSNPEALTCPFSAVIAIGVLIKGSTMHFEYIADAVSQGLMRVQLDSGVPVIFGVLTCLNDEQALQRAGVKGSWGEGHNHGIDWGKAAVELGVKRQRWSEGKFA